MTLTTNTHEFHGSRIKRHPKAVESLNLNVPQTICGYHVDVVVNEIASPEVRQIVGTVFEDLLRLLECLNLLQTHLRQPEAASETFAMFQAIEDEARALVKFISEDALSCQVLSKELAETLDGITFAVNHDLQRVFENQPLDNTPAQVLIGQLFRAYDLLTNCLQQSTISLAITFDRDLDGAKLFDNSDMRYRQSIQLCADISKLLELVEACGGNRDEPAFAKFSARVELFRNESLECLMYSDWPVFESFCERIKVAEFSSAQLEQVLHQFRCYLETLLGQVRMRAVLANVIPIQFGANETPTSSVADVEQSTRPASVEHLQANERWNDFAVAV